MSTATTGARYAVIAGLGRTGLSCARYLHAEGWRIAVTDTRPRPPELDALRALVGDIVVRAGGLDTGLLEGATLVVASPGLALTDPFFVTARARGLEVVGDIELFARAARAPAVGITGTNGKSTVTTLVARMARRAGLTVRVGGNLGEPALDLLGDPATALYVLELSSFQLETTRTLELAAATVLNVTADHMDRYATLADYAAAKARIYARCHAAVINLDDPLVAAMRAPVARDLPRTTLTFSLRAAIGADYALADRGAEEGWWLTRRGEPLMALAELRIPGLHNAANALAALALGEALALPLAAMLAELREFRGLEHRTQWVAEVGGVRYVNDSKGTNVGATLAAVSGLPGTLVIIAGGDGKGQDFGPLAAAFRDKVRHVVLIGRDAPAIAAVLEGVCPLSRAETLEAAVRTAASVARAGDTVLLSPACASLDMFRDYTQRGRVFEQAVKELAA
ncbi:MAG TPA: UDP-N-acetylmuramoyl-L-alanine--D-glutamate ligase [Steroidobacteraceae bacterium]|nr:UDP-N-acetylmuramoyl-L-alanine--D-glutamate ligase [Steroidobacteraceae bacterium]HNS27806.1 UDP-N-acetylmuramoyl-L-alanine--D-glutamate ligase [Steroidobacteraceae bacterium]